MTQTVLITGCSAGGIGSALALEFHKKGLHVFATARSLSKMSHLQSLPNITILELDVTNQPSINAAVETVRKQTDGKLDILVNNAGQSIVYPALDTNLQDAKGLFDVNFFAAIAITQAFAPLVVPSKGAIVNICSINGVMPVPWFSVYNASKAALASWSETLRLELQPFGVRVVSLITGSVVTNILSQGDVTLPGDSLYHKARDEISRRASGGDRPKNSMQPEEFARAVVGDVLGGKAGAVWRGPLAGTVKVVTALTPGWVVDNILKNGVGFDKLP
ncbi:NAD(P)-binding protein [Aspergillus karnatakaensis]|uniref:SDR family oxidoreductase n=1 Tax=Aspergillus karnatakaensis TaxID=1810916 RepID=UPI003CCCC63E